MRMFRCISPKDSLCNYCLFQYPDCKYLNVEFGDGIGKDNITGCAGYVSDPYTDLNNIEIGEIIKGGGKINLEYR